MRKIVFLFVLSLICAAHASAYGQTSGRYEVEILLSRNNRDTREINSILVFEKEIVRVVSRRNKEVFKEFRYSEIKKAEHSFSPHPSISVGEAIATAVIGIPPFSLFKNEKNWLTLQTDDYFAVLKLENDNYRVIIAELEIRKITVENNYEKRAKK